MIIKPLEAHETERWHWYQREITAATEPIKKVIKEFQDWQEALSKKYGPFPEENINRIDDDGKHIASINLNKFLGKE